LAAIGVYVAVAVVWLVPDRRIERVTSERAERGGRAERPEEAEPAGEA
jgi:hypothetical protein